MNNGYDVYFDTPYGLVTFPITPSEFSISSDSNNDTITLIDEGEVNILKSPALIEVEFEARFPMRKYPYSREPEKFQTYWEIFKKLKENKKSFRFIVARKTPDGKRTWDTNLLVSLESLETKENAEDDGDDVIVSFELKQYKPYGVTILKTNANGSNTTSTSNTNRPSSNKGSTYVVKSGDCLWLIAKRFYGKGSEWRKIYNANKSAIELDAKAHNYKSSSNGWWIFPGLKLTIPD